PETGPTIEQKVTVPAKGTANATFNFKAPTGRRSAHEVVENPHYGLEALGHAVSIVPTLKRQIP
ncbi:MAG TPA: carboxypeptidase regulatory-like domain-containing protein, partial [Nitrospirales bacterium]|nr:carboxypeptidase regulatory-like domain-containing protein [Nitrospirales bacterium]